MKFLADIGNLSWSSEGEPSFEVIICELGFRKNGELPVAFKLPLEFGARILNMEDEILHEMSFPRYGESYVYTDQEYIHAENVYDLRPDTEHKVLVWAKYGEDSFSQEFLVKTLRYLQPYPSWVYNEEEKQWIPPFPPPQDEHNYKWAQEKEVWVRSLGYNEETQTFSYSIYDEQLQDWVPYEFPKVDE